MFKKILVPTDASEYSRRALMTALEMAKLYKAEVELLHVTFTPQAYWGYTVSYGITVSQEELDRNAELVLEAATTGIDTSGVPLKKVIDSGHPVSIILDEIQKENIDLVIMGSHGYGPITGSVLGSVSQRILQRAECPVMIVR
ncbi:MAG TPA: universal stress protein [Desulfitobacteriaceae bacterium]|nr:universal stress protein [Desulfitobacteriaceae bacterium]